jgi:hypothetical protein
MEGKIPVVRYCKVISIDDDTDADRIKVRLCPEDNSKSIDEIDYAFPLLPKMFHIKPKVGEGVFVFMAITNDGNSQRYYLGPVISQDHRLFFDSYFAGGDSFLRGSYKKFDVAPRSIPANNGTLPNDDDVVVRGRKNGEIQITNDDVRLKAGVKLVNEENKYEQVFNSKNPAFAKVKYHLNPLYDGSQSSAVVCADKIALLSPSSPNYYDLTNRKDLISDEELNKVIESAYKLPYGEKLVDFLKVFVEAFVKHTHPYSMLPPNSFHTSELNTKKVELLDRGTILSDTVRIN